MSEVVILTTPETKPALSTTEYRVVGLNLQFERQLIVIHLRGTNGELREVSYGGDTPGTSSGDRLKAANLMIALNKANLSVKSLQRRVLEQLMSDGLLVGTVSGTPD